MGLTVTLLAVCSRSSMRSTIQKCFCKENATEVDKINDKLNATQYETTIEQLDA